MNKWWLYKEVSNIKRVSLFTENGGNNVRMNKNEGLYDPYFCKIFNSVKKMSYGWYSLKKICSTI